MTTDAYTPYKLLSPHKQNSVKLQEIATLLTAYLNGPKELMPNNIVFDMDTIVANKHPDADHSLSGEAWVRIVKRITRQLNEYIENDLQTSPTKYSDRCNFNYNYKNFLAFLDQKPN